MTTVTLHFVLNPLQLASDRFIDKNHWRPQAAMQIFFQPKIMTDPTPSEEGQGKCRYQVVSAVVGHPDPAVPPTLGLARVATQI